MITATYIFPEYRLAKLLRQPGGKAVADAIKDAEARVATLAARCREALVERLAALDEACGSPAFAELTPVRLDAIYDAANAMIGLGRPSGLPLLDEIAYSLCDVADAMRRQGSLAPEPLAVHRSALHFICHRSAEDARTLQAMREGLEQVRERVLGA